MTQSGRIYALEIKETNEASQGPVKETTIATLGKGCDMVKLDEVVEFLKLIKKSDYKVVD